MTVFEILTLRSEFEELVQNDNLPKHRKAGTLNNLQWFMSPGNIYNAKERAKEVCEIILKHEDPLSKN